MIELRAPIVLVLLAAAALAGGCGEAQAPEPRGTLMLMFEEQEEGLAPYATRVLVNDEYVRLDDGGDGSDFVLLDRQMQTVYSVSHHNRTVLVVHSKPVSGEPPLALTMDARRTDHPDAPAIEDQQPVEYALIVNDETCSRVMVVPDFLEQGVEGLREFRRALAGQHAENLPKTPESMLDPCFVAYHVYAPVRHLQYGFPLRQWDRNGNSRTLVNYQREFETAADLFSLPESYRRMGMAGGDAAPEV